MPKKNVKPHSLKKNPTAHDAWKARKAKRNAGRGRQIWTTTDAGFSFTPSLV